MTFQAWRSRYGFVRTYALQTAVPVIHDLPETGPTFGPPCGSAHEASYVLVHRAAVNGRECQRCVRVRRPA